MARSRWTLASSVKCVPKINLIIEDVCFPPAQLAKATEDLLDLMAKHGYQPGAGHAAYGNLHFVMIEQMSEDASRQRYDGYAQHGRNGAG